MSDNSDVQYPFEDRELARKAGRKGGHATAAKHARKRMIMEEDIETPADAKRWLSAIARGVLAGEIDSRDADVATRIIRAWLDAHKADVAEGELQELQDKITAIEDAMRGRADLNVAR